MADRDTSWPTRTLLPALAATIAAMAAPEGRAVAQEAAAPAPEVEPSLFDSERAGYLTKVGRGAALYRLGHGTSQERVEAAADLGRRRDVAAVPALLRELSQAPALSVRVAIIDALGQIGDRRAVPALLAIVAPQSPVSADPRADSPRSVDVRPAPGGGSQRVAAIRALGLIGDQRALDPIASLLGEMTMADQASEALLSMGPRVLMRAVALLREPTTTGAACSLLGRLGDRRALWPMVRALSSERPHARAQCAQALGALGDPRAQRPLLGLLTDAEAEVQRAALLALARVSDGSSSARLALVLTQREDGALVIPSLGGQGASPAIVALDRTAAAEAGPEQADAVAALGRIGGAEAAAALGRLLVSGSSSLRFQAAASMARMSRADVLDRLLHTARSTGPGQIEALRALGDLLGSAPLGPEVAPPPSEVRQLARQLLASDRAETAGSAAFLAGSIRDRGSVGQLGSLLDRDDPVVRSQAAGALGWIGGREACTQVVRALEDRDPAVRAAAAWAAGEARCWGASALLLAILDRGDARSAANAAWAAGELRLEAAAPLLARELASGEPALRANAALALAALGDHRSVRAIRRRLSDEGSPLVRAALVEALGRLPDPSSAAALLRMSESPPPVDDLVARARGAVERGRPLERARGSASFRARLVDADGNPRPGASFTVALPDRRFMTGATDTCGEITARGLPDGSCRLGVGRAPD